MKTIALVAVLCILSAVSFAQEAPYQDIRLYFKHKAGSYPARVTYADGGCKIHLWGFNKTIFLGNEKILTESEVPLICRDGFLISNISKRT
jgi:hypothetical protein